MNRILLSLLIAMIAMPFYLRSETPVMDSSISDMIITVKADSIVSYIISSYLVEVFTEDLIKERNGKIEQHIVERGETWKSIAHDCGIEESMLKALNPLDNDCFTGMAIRVANFPTVVQKINNDPAIRERLLYAVKKEESENFKEAVKIYTEILKTTPSLDAHYLRGRAYYRMGKLNQSVEDFKYVAFNDREKRFPEAKDIYQNVSEEWEAYKDERARKWVNVGLAILGTANEVLSQYLTIKNRNNQNIPFLAGGFTSSYGGYIPSGYSLPSNGVSTDYYHNGIQWPESLDPTKYFTPDVMNVEVTFDAWGNPMYSTPGIANAMNRMQQDFNMDLMKNGNITSGTVLSKALLGQLNIQNKIVADNALLLATPMYAPSDDVVSSSENSNDREKEVSKSKKCIHCDDTGWIRKSQMAVATFGEHLPKRKCDKCGYKWTPELEVHSCERCTYCSAGKF